MQEQYFYQSPQEMLEELKAGKVSAQMLLMLASEFGMRFTEKKRERNLLDFSDLEHLALQILVKKENGNVVPGEAALAFSKQFEEIMIDEYQDSNMVQELILTSISRCSMGQNNLFMVGDVKQSIYRFRLACPELFMENTIPIRRKTPKIRRSSCTKISEAERKCSLMSILFFARSCTGISEM